MAGDLEWPFKAGEPIPGRREWFHSAPLEEDGIWSYNPPSPVWEALDLSDAGTEHPLPAVGDAAGLGRVMGALDVHGACLLRGDGAAAVACTELKLALATEAANGGTVKGVAQRFAESWPLVAHPAHMKLCAGALGRQLLRVASLDELSARMSLPSTFTGGVSFKQFPFELDYARAVAAHHPTKLGRPHLGAAFVPATHDLENQLTCFWALERAVVLRFVPGSHRWPLGRIADESSAVVEVTLQPGDSLVCASGLWRGSGGRNSLMLEVGYHLAFWQTEQENQMAIGSPQAALLLPPHIARLCGWCKPGDVLNKQYSGGQRADPLGAAAHLGDRPIDWAGRVWTPATVDATPETLRVAADNWCAPQDAYRDGSSSSIPWSEYPARLAQLELPPPASSAGAPSALNSIEWPGSGASSEQLADAVEKCLGVIARDGAVILAHAVEHETMDRFMASLAAYNNQEEEEGSADGNGPAECGCVLARSTAALPLVAHPCVMGVCEGVLGRQVTTMDQSELKRRLRLAGCEDEERIPWQLQVQAFIGKPPHESPQLLHRDGEYMMLQLPAEEIEHEISCIWATHDFTNELGATRVVKGSHLWPREREPLAGESAGAEMPKGSVVIYAGHTLHGAGENTTGSWRLAMNFDYIPRFLKAECSMGLEIPPTIARYMPEPLLELAGYRSRAEVEEACWLRAECGKKAATAATSSSKL